MNEVDEGIRIMRQFDEDYPKITLALRGWREAAIVHKDPVLMTGAYAMIQQAIAEEMPNDSRDLWRAWRQTYGVGGVPDGN